MQEKNDNPNVLEALDHMGYDDLSTCKANYLLEKFKLEDKMKQCIKTSPNSGVQCVKDNIEFYSRLKKTKKECTIQAQAFQALLLENIWNKEGGLLALKRPAKESVILRTSGKFEFKW